jgi:hypothetical protein
MGVEAISIPAEFICPISHTIMTEPVILLSTGITYELSAIRRWFETSTGTPTCPVTRCHVDLTQYAPNLAMYSAISNWVRRSKAAHEGPAKRTRSKRVR